MYWELCAINVPVWHMNISGNGRIVWVFMANSAMCWVPRSLPLNNSAFSNSGSSVMSGNCQ